MESSQKVVELEINVWEKEWEMDVLNQKYKEIKAHKKILKEEVVRLMDEIKDLEGKLANS